MAATVTVTAQDDPYLWLEDVEGERAIEWVEAHNKKSLERLTTDSRFESIQQGLLQDYNASDKIAYGKLLGGAVHNFWQDETHVRGLWRRASWRSYTASEPKWVEILDIDKLAADEGENWVYKERQCLPPDFGLCLISLSRGGGDAVVMREFDAVLKQFVAGGFVTEEAKQGSVWIDKNTLLISTDFGINTMTDSGYPNEVRVWKRGYPLASARTVHTGDLTDVGSFPFASHRPEGSVIGVVRAPDFFTEIVYVLKGDKDEEEMRELYLPRTISFKGIFHHNAILTMRESWRLKSGKTIPAGSLISVNIEDAIDGIPENSLRVVFTPDTTSAIDDVAIGQNRIFINLLDTVTGQMLTATESADGWDITPTDTPENGSISLISADEWSDAALINFESFLQPSTLYAIYRGSEPATIQALPDRFDATGMIAEQEFAVSKDGTRIPYFIIRTEGAPMDGTTPTILYGYGGFEVSLPPIYLNGPSKAWLEAGGAYVIANIRGGGEFGPAWHQAALKENRQHAFDDFIAVAEHLVETGLTSKQHLGIRGGSNGGLLMGAMLTQRPDLFKAVICAVPLLDMMRYHTLLAGASWMGEYGNPDVPEERDYILKYSPYQNLKTDTEYPEVFFYTSTKDDRVHPGHARKMAAKMEDMGKPVLYYENTEGGHSAAANLQQRAFTDALQVVYALQKLKD
ncbi:prolyl oligopeptidase family serine peptidase [Kordiimonas pumila]|uniref:Prolyl oligopeptidase family protein n=1 Tax=Kordiimonas pumila TaxID=2161677 RepID=A0ABV7D6A7_9PROT|nr:prolyl oligopeptidase family serine peptidase [Kordiimonas pumila]